MADSQPFALLVLLIAAVGLVAVQSNRLTARLKPPAPVLLLVAAAVAVAVVPALHAPSDSTVEHLVTLAVLSILFDGGMHIGWTRFKAAAAPILIVGVLGTFLTVAATAVLVHLAFGLGWYVSLLVARRSRPLIPLWCSPCSRFKVHSMDEGVVCDVKADSTW